MVFSTLLSFALTFIFERRAEPLPFSLVSLIRKRGQKCGDDNEVDDVDVYGDGKKDAEEGEHKK